MKRISVTIEQLEKNVYGRTKYNNGALELCWSLSGFEFSFVADRVELHFVSDFSLESDGYLKEQPCYVKVVIDGKYESKYSIKTGAEVIMIENLENTAHTLRLYKLSESNCPIKAASVVLEGNDDTVVLPAPQKPELRFEFFGDSITCGYGDIASSNVGAFYTYQEDATKTYAYMTAKAFDADIRVVAISGQGIISNCHGEPGYRIPEFFEHEMRIGHEPHDFASWVPHVVVVNAGTNDMGGRVPDDVFKAGTDKFVDRIREVYPDTHIFWVFGMMGNRYDAVLASLFKEKGKVDSKLHYVPIQKIYDFKDECGANGHPNVKGQTRAADILIEAIRAAL
ncbi:MAG: SGNH/GDSL hydrolase family protein [Clostridiales bacterium]|nr:SGNH/GDSL hydrolase family protein [Clostridiales bacterium]